MRAVLMGPPGAGKGTQAVRLAAAWKVPHVSTGDLLREAVARDTDLGRRVKSTLDAGGLVPDDLMAELLRERLGRDDCRRGFVLDGYPRTERQARDLDSILAETGAELDRVILLEAPDDVVVRRVGGRRTCSACRAVTHVDSLAGGRTDTCERCGGRLSARADDDPRTVRRRLEVYRDETRPVVERYRRAGLLAVVDGQGSPDEVYARLLPLLQAAPR